MIVPNLSQLQKSTPMYNIQDTQKVIEMLTHCIEMIRNDPDATAEQKKASIGELELRLAKWKGVEQALLSQQVAVKV